ncbi:hypothetical protein PL78_04585 [Yersinia entomophaga]|uniref:Uncharacterized protein n=1 Tax=Yersinia entomophaga TaxID=935293 RepID=A0ABN4PRZ3_YERET|nr:hypothetical protein [Yersinia entomophaga]ANI29116.1 hypothetical protein PL78_04585 [Yersinia entomophaga]OWF87505.1 hypothetical protein B4914_10965 [Yersinia entomophaga]
MITAPEVKRYGMPFMMQSSKNENILIGVDQAENIASQPASQWVEYQHGGHPGEAAKGFFLTFKLRLINLRSR